MSTDQQRPADDQEQAQEKNEDRGSVGAGAESALARLKQWERSRARLRGDSGDKPERRDVRSLRR